MLGLGAMEDEVSQEAEPFLDTEAFPHFAALLAASGDYARCSGCRFRKASFSDLPEGNEPLEGRVAAKVKAAPLIKEFLEKVERHTDDALSEELNKAFNILWAESMRSSMAARCQQLELWPPCPPPPGIDDLDTDYAKDTTCLLAMAQRLYNQDRLRKESHTRRLSTASFLADFAFEAGLPTPPFFGCRDPAMEKPLGPSACHRHVSPSAWTQNSGFAKGQNLFESMKTRVASTLTVGSILRARHV
ncbi:unnamed protein product [Effrenium voratum]|uniref:Uncharacterized protein n=1 Tax=Effrenium voratum TaxID=2562239 RepID=A0AA36IHU5_9DINO|nr:unnamed protein product [Effrenium voratum]